MPNTPTTRPPSLLSPELYNSDYALVNVVRRAEDHCAANDDANGVGAWIRKPDFLKGCARQERTVEGIKELK